MKKQITIPKYINWQLLQIVPKHVISYLEWGDPNNSKVIVCAHGLTRNAYDFEKIAIILAQKYRVIAIDYPGRGDSEWFENKKYYNYHVYVRDSIFILNLLNIKKPIWLGTSMGGIIGMVLASRYKNIFTGMILNDIGPFIPSKVISKINKYASQTQSFKNLDSAKQHLKNIYSGFGIINEDDWDTITKNSFIKNPNSEYSMKYDPKVSGKSSRTKNTKIHDVNLWSMWEKINTPTLLVHGLKSDILSTNTIEKMKKSNNITVHTIEYAGHAPALMSEDQILPVQEWIIRLFDS